MTNCFMLRSAKECSRPTRRRRPLPPCFVQVFWHGALPASVLHSHVQERRVCRSIQVLYVMRMSVVLLVGPPVSLREIFFSHEPSSHSGEFLHRVCHIRIAVCVQIASEALLLQKINIDSPLKSQARLRFTMAARPSTPLRISAAPQTIYIFITALDHKTALFCDA